MRPVLGFLLLRILKVGKARRAVSVMGHCPPGLAWACTAVGLVKFGHHPIGDQHLQGQLRT